KHVWEASTVCHEDAVLRSFTERADCGQLILDRDLSQLRSLTKKDRGRQPQQPTGLLLRCCPHGGVEAIRRIPKFEPLKLKTRDLTRSDINSGNRSGLPSALRNSVDTFLPSAYRSSLSR